MQIFVISIDIINLKLYIFIFVQMAGNNKEQNKVMIGSQNRLKLSPNKQKFFLVIFFLMLLSKGSSSMLKKGDSDILNLEEKNNQDNHLLKQAKSNVIQINKKIFKPSLNKIPFPSKQLFQLPIDIPIIERQQRELLESLGFYDKIQLGSSYDYLNMTNKINFTDLSKKMHQSIPYEEIWFSFDPSLEKQLKIIQLNYLQNQEKEHRRYAQVVGVDIKNQNFTFQLAKKIVLQPENNQIKQIEYKYYNQVYGFNNINEQNSICIFSPGGKLVPKNNYQQYFESLQKQNYTNFHIVYVYDNAEQYEIQTIVNYLLKNKFSLNNRIKIIHTFTRLDVLANMYFFINKYCYQNDIVISVDADDSLIGHQALKVVNSVYNDPQVWVANSFYAGYNQNQKKFQKGNISQNKSEKASQYRTSFKWEVSHLRTFRKKLYQKVPLYMNLQYHLNFTNLQAFPQFYSFAPDAFQMFNMVQLGGDNHYRFMQAYLYLYSGVGSSDPKNCYIKHAPYDAHKARLKTPYLELESIQDPAVQKKNYRPPLESQKKVKDAYIQYVNCTSQWVKTTQNNAKIYYVKLLLLGFLIIFLIIFIVRKLIKQFEKKNIGYKTIKTTEQSEQNILQKENI